MNIINDDRLNSSMRRTRNGSTMEFYNPENRSLQSRDADVIIKAPRRELSAELVDGVWTWMNKCPECNGEEPQWAYVKCDKHDTCVQCGMQRKNIEGSVWGHKKGFMCNPCHDILAEAAKRSALEKVASKEYDIYDYYNNGNVVCPHCGTETEPETADGLPEGKETCEVCGGVYDIEPEYSVTYSTTVIGKRVMLDDNDE